MNADDPLAGAGGMSPVRAHGPVAAELLRQIVDRAPDAMVVVAAPDFRIVYANPAARRAARRGTVGELAGRLAGELFAFFDPALASGCARAALKACVVTDRQAGPRVWWDVSYVALDSAVLVTAVDVTGHAIARAEAEAARDTLDALLAYIPEGITIAHGADVHVDYVSARGVALVGRDATELTGHSALQQTDVWEVYLPGSDVPLPPQDRPLARATRTGAVTMNETLVLKRPDGSLLTVLGNSGPIRDGAGRVTGAIIAWQDITELQRAQAALRDSEARLRAVLLQIPAAIFILGAPDGQVVFKSHLLDQVLGTPELDMPTAKATLRGWALHPDGRPYDLAEYPSRRALFQGETVRAEPMIFSRGDGRLIDLELYAGPVRSEAGDIVAAVAVVLDVTARNQSAAQLRESEARLRVALEAGRLGTWEIDLATNTNHIGEALAHMLGLPAAPVALDRSVSAGFIHPDDRDQVRADFARAVEAGDDYVAEFRAVRTDGVVRWVTAHGRVLRGADGRPARALGVIRDVTDRRQREDRLREAVEARELLLREADHRIKNSLQLVGSLLTLQRSRLSDPDAVAALDGAISRVMAVGEAHRALHQSADLRHVALDDMLRDLCAHVGTLNPALTFVCDCPAALELDTERAIPLGLVVSELLTNAAKHAYPAGAGAVCTTVAVTDGVFEITVSDDGVGLAGAGTPRARLGSSIVRALVAQIGAAMDVESAPGEGTRTRLRFPRRV
jgi:PAS domain S-box-containing protein